MTIERDIAVLRRNVGDVTAELRSASALVLNKAATRVRQIAVPQVSDDVKVPAKNIRDRISTRRASAVNLKTSLRIGRKQITAYGLGARVVTQGKNKGVIAGKGQFAHRYERAFIGHRRGDARFQIFQRVGSARYPLIVPKIDLAPSINKRFPSAAQQVMDTEYDAMMRDEVRARLQKYGVSQ